MRVRFGKGREEVTRARPTARQLPRRSPPVAAIVLETLPDGVIACDARGTIVASNSAAQAILGARGTSVGAREWSKRFSLFRRGGGEMLGPHELPLTVALSGREVRDLEVELRAGDARHAVDVSGGPVWDADGQIEGAVIVLHDVTARVAADDELRLQAAIAANVAAGITLVRAADGAIVDVNAAALRMLGYDQRELVGRHISAVTVPSRQAPEVRAREMASALEVAGFWTGEIQNLRKDGTRFWCAATVSAFEHPEHGTTWILVEADISARKAAEDELRIAEERFHHVFEAAPVGIALVGNDLRMTDANVVLSEITGYDRDELVGMALAEVTYPDDIEIDAALSARMFRGEIPRYRINKRFVTKRGDVTPVALTATCVRDAADRPLHYIAIVERLTARSIPG